jgi:NTE family protein
LLDKVPEGDLTDEELALKQLLATLPSVTLLHLIYQQAAYETQAKDYEFSAVSMRDHWESGYRDTSATLKHKDWLQMTQEDGGIAVHDVHHIES